MAQHSLGTALTTMGTYFSPSPYSDYLIDTALRGPDLPLIGPKLATTGLVRALVAGEREHYTMNGQTLETAVQFEDGISELNAWIKRLVANTLAISRGRRMTPPAFNYLTWAATVHWLGHTNNALGCFRSTPPGYLGNIVVSTCFETALCNLGAYLSTIINMDATFKRGGRSRAQDIFNTRVVPAGLRAIGSMGAFLVAAGDHHLVANRRRGRKS